MVNYQDEINNLQDMSLFFLKNNDKEIKGKFSNARINKDTIPEGIYAYDFRGGDDEYLCTLEQNVLVNHEGTFICNEKIDFGRNGYLTLLNYEESNLSEADLDYSFN